jgi:hypothetical protein
MFQRMTRRLGSITLLLSAACLFPALERASSQTRPPKVLPKITPPPVSNPHPNSNPNLNPNPNPNPAPGSTPGLLRPGLPKATATPKIRMPAGRAAQVTFAPALRSPSRETVGYSVADLVVPIPNAINARTLQQSATLFGAYGAFGFGGQLGGYGLTGFGGLNAAGGQLGGFGAAGGFAGMGGINGGVLGALGQAGGVLGAGGGAPANFGGMGGINGGAANFGNGGQFGGGQLGQFGQLGGGFGFQGGTQEAILILTIRQLVGTPSDWAPFVPVPAVPNAANPPFPDDNWADVRIPIFGTLMPARTTSLRFPNRPVLVPRSAMRGPGRPNGRRRRRGGRGGLTTRSRHLRRTAPGEARDQSIF